MQYDPREIEMQTYALSYSYPVSNENLPWDNETSPHAVVFNEHFYSLPEMQMDLAPPPVEDPFEYSHDEVMEEFQAPEPVWIPETASSKASTEASGGVAIGREECGMMVPLGTNLDEQLNFIIESTKKRVKPIDKQKKRKRSRKSKAQLEILNRELANKSGVGKEIIKRVAKETGLKEIQVYKWYWDHKAKDVLPL